MVMMVDYVIDAMVMRVLMKRRRRMNDGGGVMAMVRVVMMRTFVRITK